jgi:hypothetical protein
VHPGLKRWRWLSAIAVFAVAFPVYLRTLAPSLPTGDSGELITAAAVLGIAHPPGYPLFTMLGHLFTFLPFGSVAMRVNLMSAFFHVSAAALIGLCVFRLIEGQRRSEERGALVPWQAATAAVVAGLALAFSSAFWLYGVVAEVFAMNSLFAALLLLILFEWERRPERVWVFWIFALGCGLAASNHHTIVLLAPAFLTLLVSGARRLFPMRRGRLSNPYGLQVWHLLVAAALVLVGLLPYVYLPLAARADPPLNWGDPQSWERFRCHVLRCDYGTFSLTAGDAPQRGDRLEHVALLARYWFHAFTPFGYALAAAGTWWLARRRWVEGLALTLALLFTGPAFVAFANPYFDNDILRGVLERFYILPSSLFAILVGLGAYQVICWARDGIPRVGRLAAPVAAAGLLVIPVGAAAAHLPAIDQSENLVDHNFAVDLLGSLDRDALLLMRGDVVTMAVEYAQYVEGMRPDVVAMDMEKLKLPGYVRQMRRQHPHITIPFDQYDEGYTASMRLLIDAELPNRPVYMLGNAKEKDFGNLYEGQKAGFVNRVRPLGTRSDAYEIMRARADEFRRFHFPDRTYPTSTFEAGVVDAYGAVAADLAYALDDGVRNNEAVEMYKVAIQLNPKNPYPYKNLGLLLYKLGGQPAAVTALWQEYVRMVPTDPEAPEMRRYIDSVRAEGSR